MRKPGLAVYLSLLAAMVLLGGVFAFARPLWGDRPDVGFSTSQASGSEWSIYCGSYSQFTATPPESVEMLAWVSHEIVLGTVVKKLEPQWTEPVLTGVDPQLFGGASLRMISTEYVVRVEDRVRGSDHDEIRISIAGGTIGDCTIANSLPELVVGDLHLFFLSAEGVPAARDTGSRPLYYLVDEIFGTWEVMDDGRVVPQWILEKTDPAHNAREARLLADNTYDLADLRQRLLMSLKSGSPPEGETQPIPIVSLDEAPIHEP